MARLNKPKPVGDIFKAIGQDWTLYHIEGDRYKLCSNAPREGSANYTLTIKNNQIVKRDDCYNLRTEHPSLFEELEKLFGKPESFGSDNAYGDRAMADHKPVTPEQAWNRRILWLREKYIGQAQVGIETDLRLAINTLYPPIFGEPPSEKVIQETTDYLRRGDIPSKEAFFEVLQAYYSGAYRPKSCENLATQLDIIQNVF